MSHTILPPENTTNNKIIQTNYDSRLFPFIFLNIRVHFRYKFGLIPRMNFETVLSVNICFEIQKME